MQFGRESDNHPAPTVTAPSTLIAHDEKGWICSKDPDHFRHTA
jgi:hypothetical protein